MVELAHTLSQVILPGATSGEALAARVPLSFWGGYDPESGRIIDQRHPLAGADATNRMLLIPAGRGSCSGSGVLLESIQNGTAPAAIILSQVDPIICLGGILGDELCESHPTIVVIAESIHCLARTGDRVTIDEAGWLTISRIE
jgi:predicted aconitase with swiveling domain